MAQLQLQQVLQALATLDTTFMVQDTKEFLQDFSLIQFENPVVINIFRALLAAGPPNAVQIGDPSAVGTVYQLGNGAGVPASLQGKILKESPMCPGGALPASPLLAQLCQMARTGDLIFRFPNTETGKMIVLAPNYILEGLCGVLLSRLDPYTSAFMQVDSFQYDNGPTKAVFTVQEPLISIDNVVGTIPVPPGNPSPVGLHPELDFAFVAFQIAQGLASAQMASRFTHYDLHTGNVMARRCTHGAGGLSPCGTSIYEIGNGQYLYARRPADAVIIDYGHIRMETQDSVLQPNMWFFARGTYNREIMDWYEFNPYYDLFSFLYTQDNKSRQRGVPGGFPMWMPPMGTVENARQRELFKQLWRAFLNTAQQVGEDQFMNNIINHIRGGPGNHWRPIPENLSMKWTDPDTNFTFSRASTPQEFMAKVAGIIKSLLPPFVGSPTNPVDINNYLNNNEYYVSTQITKLNIVGSPTKVYKLPRDVMRQEFYNYKTDNEPIEVLPGIVGNIATIATERWTNAMPVVGGTVRAAVTRCAPGVGWETWNKTGVTGILPANQLITVATIDVARGLREGYKFRLDCCRLDLRAYFQDVDVISSGIGINAAFFKIQRPGHSYLPVGDFRTPGFSSDISVPAAYLEWYGVVAVQDNGKLVIVNPTQAGAYRQILTVGPVLVGFDSVAGVVRNMVGSGLPYGEAGTWPRRINLRNPRFQCTIGGGGGMNNCNTISPGEFSHASNPNPRSALGIKEDGTTVLVTVQGRGVNAAGMDLEQLAQLMVGLGCHWAINLDGGRSSRMAWRNPGEALVRLTSGAQEGMGSAEAYPVGSVLAFTKE